MPYITIRPRRGTSSEWFEENPVLEKGEFVIEHPMDGAGTGACRFKIGDGKTPYGELPYALDYSYSPLFIDGGGVENFCLIQIKEANVNTWQSENPVLKSRELGYDSTNNVLKVGDGIHKWRNLRPLRCDGLTSGELDFGDEEGDISSQEAIVRSNVQYKGKCLPSDWDDPLKDPDAEYNATGGVDQVVGISALLGD